MNNKSSKVKTADKDAVEGVVTARKCDCCGHHEIGITTQAGTYVPLKPGIMIKIIGQAKP